MITPRVEIDITKINHNIKALKNHFDSKEITMMLVTKIICGNPTIIKALEQKSIPLIGDSRIQNIKKMHHAGIKAIFVLVRSPLLSQVNDVVKYAHISHNTEYKVIQKLSEIARKKNSKHKIILMIELGDLREGIMPNDIFEITEKVIKLKGIQLVGIGTNLACFSGIEPDDRNMKELSAIARQIETRFKIKLKYVSGGSSANYNWTVASESIEKISHLRIGEAVFLGREPLRRDPIPDLYTDAFTLVTEVIESKIKPSAPKGSRCQDSFGKLPRINDQGLMHRIILGVGRQDVRTSGLTHFYLVS